MLDLLFSNIKHLFFQPCDNELIVLLHVHLHTPVMVGKKKTRVTIAYYMLVIQLTHVYCLGYSILS
jgi:nucleosome binding factor SPN SPT16 subunit